MDQTAEPQQRDVRRKACVRKQCTWNSPLGAGTNLSRRPMSSKTSPCKIATHFEFIIGFVWKMLLIGSLKAVARSDPPQGGELRIHSRRCYVTARSVLSICNQSAQILIF